MRVTSTPDPRLSACAAAIVKQHAQFPEMTSVKKFSHPFNFPVKPDSGAH
ncbi:MAG: hypothetical protein H0T89_04990 [Deltaproteobacteria bacterium]|nr:hypothetical protein [Deltaproteobacteria bacterium]